MADFDVICMQEVEEPFWAALSRSAWVKEQQVRCENGKITEYQVNLMVTFVLED